MIQAINTEDATPILTQRKSWNMLKPQMSILLQQPFTSSVNDPGLSCNSGLSPILLIQKIPDFPSQSAAKRW